MKFLENGNKKARARVILAHGAGAHMDSPFMNYFAEALGGEEVHVIRFEFPYMAQRRLDGAKRPPDRQPKLLACWEEVITHFGPADKLVIGGKSMGGRMASLIADPMQVKGLLCLGYPFYATGRPDKPRTEHLQDLETPTLIVQGERDSMGNHEAVQKYALSPKIEFFWCPDGDHSFKPRKVSGRTEAENWDAAIVAIQEFLAKIA